MKYLFVILFGFMTLVVSSQEEDRITHDLFFMKPGDYHLKKISEGDHCIVGLREKGQQFSGPILKISSDSLFINDTILRVKNIAYFRFKDELRKPFLISKPADFPKAYIVYGNDTLIWKIFIPPASVYSSRFEYDQYVWNLVDSAKYSVKRDLIRRPVGNFRKPGKK